LIEVSLPTKWRTPFELAAWRPPKPDRLLGWLEFLVGKGPIVAVAAECYFATMGLILLILVLVILFGGGGFYFGGPVIGGGGLGLVLLICLIIYFVGGFRSRT
jgi:hypothetical protein